MGTDPRYLEGYSPTPTGTSHTATLYHEEWEAAQQLIFGMDQAQRWGDTAEVDALREQLMCSRWWPRGWVAGDHLNIRVVPRSQVLVSLGLAR